MEPAAHNSANTNYEGLEPIVEWLKAHSDSRDNRFEGTPLALNDTSYAGPDHVADRLQASSDSCNDELTNEMSPVTIAAVASPRQRRLPKDPNGRYICTHQNCGQTFRSSATLRHHKAKHKPAAFSCEECNYSTWRKDMLQAHYGRRHPHYTDLLKCQKCKYETYHRDDFRKHQERHDAEKPFRCEECNYGAWRKDMVKSHYNRRHRQYTDRLKCQKCDYETYHEIDLRRHQRGHERQHVEGTADTRQ